MKLIFILTFFIIFMERVFVKFRRWHFSPDHDFEMQPAFSPISSSKDLMSCLRGFQILEKQTILFFQRLSCHVMQDISG